MVQDSTTFYVWVGGSCGYGHKEPTHEARAETKLVWALPCKKEEDESQRAGGAAVVIEHDGSIISRDVISDLHTTSSVVKFGDEYEQRITFDDDTLVKANEIIDIKGELFDNSVN